MRLTLVILNALIIASVAVFFTLAVIYGPPGAWGTADALKLLAFLIPCIAALISLRKGSSSLMKSIAAWCSVVWAVVLMVLSLGAMTGIGGGAGLLIVIIPALLLLSLNWVALRWREA
jgi:hypothetical protein